MGESQMNATKFAVWAGGLVVVAAGIGIAAPVANADQWYCNTNMDGRTTCLSSQGGTYSETTTCVPGSRMCTVTSGSNRGWWD